MNENNESFNFGYKDGVRGFYTNPSRADDSFIPFKSMEDLRIDVALMHYFSSSYIDIPNIGYSTITTVATENPYPTNGLKLQIDTDGTGTFTTIHQFGDNDTEITADVSNAKTIRICAGTGGGGLQKGYIVLTK